MSKQQRIRLRLDDGRLLSLKVVSVSFGERLPAPPPDPVTLEVVYVRPWTLKETRPAPAGCPVCAHNLSLMPDLQGRVN